MTYTHNESVLSCNRLGKELIDVENPSVSLTDHNHYVLTLLLTMLLQWVRNRKVHRLRAHAQAQCVPCCGWLAAVRFHQSAAVAWRGYGHLLRRGSRSWASFPAGIWLPARISQACQGPGEVARHPRSSPRRPSWCCPRFRLSVPDCAEGLPRFRPLKTHTRRWYQLIPTIINI